MNDKHLSLFGLKFHPFRPDVPLDALLPVPAVDAFCRRVEFTLPDGGFAMVTGEPGTGKSVALRLLAQRLRAQRDVLVGSVDHPQSRISDFYRELGELFGVALPAHNRWIGFKGLRARWAEHIESTRTRPILIIDEAQEMLTSVFNEMRILSSKEFDSHSLLCVVFAGDDRLPQRLRHPDLQPIGSRIRRRLHLEAASRDELLACLDHLLEAAGNPSLMTTELKATIAEHAAGNYRILANIADELLAAAAEKQLHQLDEKLYLEVFAPPVKKATSGRKR
ncbi:MAG: ATP-binding protein [Thermoanaerobaculia bacterium]|nr:ATP-binding protein [Thermoanaerobaculia bacterium]